MSQSGRRIEQLRRQPAEKDEIRAAVLRRLDGGRMAAAKAAGEVRMEGKDYVMHDGDVVEFRSGITSGGKK